jgi:hypothetical protein
MLCRMNHYHVNRTGLDTGHAPDAEFAVKYIDILFKNNGVYRADLGAISALITHRNLEHTRYRKFALNSESTFFGVVLLEVGQCTQRLANLAA